MKVEITLDFSYAFDGIRPTSLEKGEVLETTEKIAKSMIKSGRAKIYVKKVSAPKKVKKEDK
jgi:hypothetical protein